MATGYTVNQEMYISHKRNAETINMTLKLIYSYA